LGRTPNKRIVQLLDDPALSSLEEVRAAYERLFEHALSEKDADGDGRWLTQTAFNILAADQGLLELPDPEKLELEKLGKQRSELAAKVPESAFGLVSVEDAPRNARLHIGGNAHNPGEEVPRGFLRVLLDAEAASFQSGVIVNRIWKHHFGEGLVRTPDNFGLTGERPTHPELLDTLAARFVAGGWSMKALHRELVLSGTYRMSSQTDRNAAAVDGNNRLLHHMPVRRLEAEAIRDAILAATGSLDPGQYGLPVPPHISDYQDGRGKPPTGPVDGAGRRSVYVGVRRNFLPPLFLAFDYPMSVTTIGRRGASAMPSQALILMNNEFVSRETSRWAERLQSRYPEAKPRLEAMFQSAFGRLAETVEIEKSLRFVGEQAKHYGNAKDAELRAWADLGHVLLNSKEFIFIR
jgi:hypothetical protein